MKILISNLNVCLFSGGSLINELHEPIVADERTTRRSQSQQQLQPITATVLLLLEQQQPEQTAVLLRRTDSNGHPIDPPEKGNPVRNLRVHNLEISVLRAKQEGLAELDQT